MTTHARHDASWCVSGRLDVARGGLYLRLAKKEALFRAAVSQELDAALDEVSRRLNEEGGGLEAGCCRVGRVAGAFRRVNAGIRYPKPARQPVGAHRRCRGFGNRSLHAQLTAVIVAELTKADRRRLGVTPEEVTVVLYTVGQGAKYLSRTRAEFVARATAAAHLVFAGFQPTKGCRPLNQEGR